MSTYARKIGRVVTSLENEGYGTALAGLLVTLILTQFLSLQLHLALFYHSNSFVNEHNPLTIIPNNGNLYPSSAEISAEPQQMLLRFF